MKRVLFLFSILFPALTSCFRSTMKMMCGVSRSKSLPSSVRDESFKSAENYCRIISKMFLTAIPVVSALGIANQNVQAKTYFDITVYGDKELKIATVNKLKQKLRNAILQDISLAPDLLKLVINDALGFDLSTLDGGSDGSIAFEMQRSENQGLERAFATITNIKKDLLRTNVVTLSDVIAFGGSEALEAVGCERIAVQVGRFDSNKENKKSLIVPWNNLSDIKLVKEAFTSSGLDIKDIAVLLGALGEIDRVVRETNESISLSKASLSEDEDDEPLDEEPFVPVTFGTRDAIYGAKVGRGDFSSKYFMSLLRSGSASGEALGRVLLADADIKAYVVKYSTNQRAFTQDLAESYLKLTSIGKEFTNRNS